MLCTIRGRILRLLLSEVPHHARPQSIGTITPPFHFIPAVNTGNHIGGSRKITVDCWSSRLDGFKTNPGVKSVSSDKAVLAEVSRSLKKSPSMLSSMAPAPRRFPGRAFTTEASLSAGTVRPVYSSVTPSFATTISREGPVKAVASIIGGTPFSTGRRFLSTHPSRPRSQQKNGNGNGNGNEHRYDEAFLSEDPTKALKKSLAAVPQYASKNEMKLRVTELDVDGNIKMTAGEFLKTDLCQQHGLHPRDLRKIDGGFSHQIPVVLVRPEVILVNLGNIRALIKSDLVLLFDLPDDNSSGVPSLFVRDLQEKLRNNPAAFFGQPFEFRVLETIFISVVASLHAEMEVVAHAAMDLLGHLEEDINQTKLKELLHHTKKVGRFESKTLLIRNVFDELLNTDEDLAAMYLSDKKAGHPRPTDSHDEIEILLEAYLKQVEEIANVVSIVKHQIQSTEDYVNVVLGAKRVQLLLFELRVAMGTLGISSGAIIAGFYGMNMPNYLEASPYAFTAVVSSSVLVTSTVFAMSARKLRILAKGTT